MYGCKTMFYCILKRCCANVTILIPITFYYSIYRSYHHIMAEIKFTFLIEKWFLYVGLNYISFKIAIIMALSFFKYCTNLEEIHTYCYAITSVCKLTWFNYPHVLYRNSRRTCWTRCLLELLFFLF